MPLNRSGPAIAKWIRWGLAIFIWSPLWSADFVRVQLVDGSSIPITPTFDQIKILQDDAYRKLLLGQSDKNVLFFALIDDQLAPEDFQPQTSLRQILGREELVLAPPQEGSEWPRLTNVDDFEGSQVAYAARKVDRGTASFFLIGIDPDFSDAKRDFFDVVNHYIGRPVSWTVDRQVSGWLMGVALVLLLVNVGFLWVALRRFARLSSSVELELDV